MRRICPLILLLGATAAAQEVIVTANLKTLTREPVTTRTQVNAQLLNCSKWPRVIGGELLLPMSPVSPDGNGNVSFPLTRNDFIDCDGATNSQYRITVSNDGKVVLDKNWQFTTATADLTTLPPVGPPVPPPAVFNATMLQGTPVSAALPSDGQAPIYSAATRKYEPQTPQGGGSTPDATPTTKGKVQLAGDLSGTADSPTVPGLATKENGLGASDSTKVLRGDRQWVAPWADWANVAGKPSTFTPSAHGHAESEITNLNGDLAAKEAVVNKGAANGYPSLDASAHIPIAQIPTLGSAQLATANKTETKCFTLLDPITTDSGRMQFEEARNITLTRVYCNVKAATSVTVDFEKRSELTPETAGTQVLATDLVCPQSGSSVTAFASPAVPAHTPLALTVPAVNGTPDTLRACVEYTID